MRAGTAPVRMTPMTQRLPPITKHQAKAPGIGRGGVQIRGSAAQRRDMYEMFRAETVEIRDRLMAIIRDPESDNGHVIMAAKEVLNRGWGAAPQVNVIEQVFQHKHEVNLDNLKQMSRAELAAVEGFLARLITVEGAEDAVVVEDNPPADADEDDAS